MALSNPSCGNLLSAEGWTRPPPEVQFSWNYLYPQRFGPLKQIFHAATFSSKTTLLLPGSVLGISVALVLVFCCCLNDRLHSWLLSQRKRNGNSNIESAPKSRSDPADQKGDALTSSINPDLPPALDHNSPYRKQADRVTRRCSTTVNATSIQKSKYGDVVEKALAISLSLFFFFFLM